MDVKKKETEYKYTKEDLKTMQAWSFERKIQVTQAKVIQFYEHFKGNCYVSFSGGKDSLCLLNLARRCYPDIEAVYVDTGLEFPEVRKFALSHKNVTVLKPEMRFDEVIKEHGWCYSSKDVASAIYYYRKGSKWAKRNLQGLNKDGTTSKYRQDHYTKWDFLFNSSIKISDKCCAVMKEKPLNKYEKESGKHPIIGTLASESHRRKVSWYQTGCNAFESKRQLSKPISFWTEQDILRYLRDFNIPYASVYGDIIKEKGRLRTTGESRTGCIFCPVGCHLDKVNRFQRLQITHPKLYDYVINTLNLCELLDFIGVNYRAESDGT